MSAFIVKKSSTSSNSVNMAENNLKAQNLKKQGHMVNYH